MLACPGSTSAVCRHMGILLRTCGTFSLGRVQQYIPVMLQQPHVRAVSTWPAHVQAARHCPHAFRMLHHPKGGCSIVSAGGT